VSARPRPLALAAVVAVLAAGGACHRRETVATVVEASGVVERSDGRDGAGWQAAAPGLALGVGDTLRTGERSSARLRLVNGSLIRLSEKGRLRFLRGGVARAGAPGEPELAVELGSAEIEQAAEDTVVETPLGRARIARGTRLRLRATGGDGALEVLVGRAVVLRPDGQMAVEAGEGVRIKIGDAAIERFRVTIGATIVEPQPPPAPPPQQPPPAPPELSAPSPPAEAEAPPRAAAPAVDEAAARADDRRADVTLAAGESATVHDARPSLLVRLRFHDVCPGDGVVELGKGKRARRLTGTGAIVTRLRAGVQRYRIRCAGDASGAKPRATGLLALKRDSGNVPLSRRAPVDVIDSDGRRYTVLYQSRLPSLTLVWPSAPAGADSLALHLESPAGARVFPGTTARRALKSGMLGDGTYTWWYATDDDRRSPKTTVTIRFDNAAPTAQFFRANRSRAAERAGTIPIDGVTMVGARVTIAGASLPVDDGGRFQAAASPQPGDDAVAVRLEHPRTGIHYYVRRAPGASGSGRRAHRAAR